MYIADNDIQPTSCTGVFITMAIMQFNKNTTDRAKEDTKAAHETLNAQEVIGSSHCVSR